MLEGSIDQWYKTQLVAKGFIKLLILIILKHLVSGEANYHSVVLTFALSKG